MRIGYITFVLIIAGCAATQPRWSLSPEHAALCQAYVKAVREKNSTLLEPLFHPLSRTTLFKKTPPDKQSYGEIRFGLEVPNGEARCQFTPANLIKNFENGGLRYRIQDLIFVFPEPVTHNMAVYVLTSERPVLIHNEAIRSEGNSALILLPSGIADVN
jgi:hypothetical protein